MPQIDKTTFQAAMDKFEFLYGRLDEIGLSQQAKRDLLKYRKIPSWIIRTNAELARELQMIADEFKNILVKVMKLRRTL